MKLLFIMPNPMGDAILASGLLEHFRQKHPLVRITLVCHPVCAALFAVQPGIERVISLKKEPHHRHWWKLWQQTAGTLWNVIVDLRNSPISFMIPHLKRYAKGGKSDYHGVHRVEDFSKVLKLSSPAAPSISVPLELQAWAAANRKANHPLICIGGSAGWPGKRWFPDRFAAVIRHMITQHRRFANAGIFLVGAPGEEAQNAAIAELLPDLGVTDFTGKTDTAELAALIGQADFFLGCDNGPMHLAAALNIPTLGLFGPGYPDVYRPWGKNTAYVSTPETVDELAAAIPDYHPRKITESMMASLSTEAVCDAVDALFRAL